MIRKNLNKVVFLDRDGVLNEDSPDYIKSCSEFIFIPGSADAVRLLTENEFNVIVITNQSAVNRKMISVGELKKIFTKMNSGIRDIGGKIVDIFYCPHVPEEECDCRKPKPGLIYQARDLYGIDLADSCMVGDSVKDIECAKNAGCGLSILVRTGNGVAAQSSLAEKNIQPNETARDLYDAALWIIDHYTIRQSSNL